MIPMINLAGSRINAILPIIMPVLFLSCGANPERDAAGPWAFLFTSNIPSCLTISQEFLIEIVTTNACDVSTCLTVNFKKRIPIDRVSCFHYLFSRQGLFTVFELSCGTSKSVLSR